MAFSLNSACELALRRALFLLILLIAYLCLGSIVLRIISCGELNNRSSRELLERLDFKRTELLNVLWAESIGRSEHDWSLLANQKLDAYEKSLLYASQSSSGSFILASDGDDEIQENQIRSFPQAFHHAFLLITTIGGVNIAGLTTSAKIFSVVYAIFGIPITLMYIGLCSKVIMSFFPGNRAILAAGSALLLSAVVVDVVEQNEDDTPFVDALLNVFLMASTVGGVRNDGVPAWILYILSTFSLASFSVAFVVIQRQIERRIGGYELAFSQKVAQIERVISEHRLDVVEEEVEEEETKISLSNNFIGEEVEEDESE